MFARTMATGNGSRAPRRWLTDARHYLPQASINRLLGAGCNPTLGDLLKEGIIAVSGRVGLELDLHHMTGRDPWRSHASSATRSLAAYSFAIADCPESQNDSIPALLESLSRNGIASVTSVS